MKGIKQIFKKLDSRDINDLTRIMHNLQKSFK
jgi:hypothetical protein